MNEINVSNQNDCGTSRASLRKAVQQHIRAFYNEEDGVIVAFSVWFMLLILFVGALGVDVMRLETQRSRLQASLDQAVLAAADLDQTRPPADVVASYFERFDVDAELVSTVVDEGLNYRNVKARAEQVVPTHIMHMLGVRELVAPAVSEAEERVEGVEISMILDVSGSMDGNRINRLKPAAIDFVDTVLALSDDDDVSISIVPYATQVGAGQTLMSQFRNHGDNEFSYCLNFESDDFDVTTMQPLSSGSHSYERTMHFDPWYEAEDPQGLDQQLTWGRQQPRNHTLPVCPQYEHSQILPFTNDTTDLYARINGLDAGGNTSIDVGVKWGAALLDPSLQPVVTNLIASGDVESKFSHLPTSYSDPDSMKIMVVMTDGQNTSQYMLRDEFRSGNSDVYYNPNSETYAVKYGSRYYYQHNDGDYPIYTYNWTYNLSSSYQRLTYPQLFARVSNEYIDDILYKNIGSYNWDSSPRTYVGGSTKDSRLQDICTAVKNQGVIVYAIGFEAPQHGSDQLEACASSPSHFFDVEGLEISEAFAAIAQSISQLRLVQ
ncbi:hypothetical protein KO498_13890 [Lentibacter algarum]|uniref:TadE/TadG family type IV pilus assembly protein n=1 Tax=Lentibacter algarum TaxID=576131 RepID=UPI001C09991F|nr:TadE/TadG family type IV pilus assembly protein [Lentibacter algarum]MBU2982905.1 hypothetical protein [Lentibacter algarum]